MKIIFEIAIGIFAGYCCCYFIADKTVSMSPEKVVEEWLKMVTDELKNRSVQEYNEGIYVYVIYRIVWETKLHYVLYLADSEEEAKMIVNSFSSNEYYYEKVKVN